MLMTGQDIVAGTGMGPIQWMYSPRPFVQRVSAKGLVGMPKGLNSDYDEIPGIRELENPGDVVSWVATPDGEVRAGMVIKGTKYYVTYRGSIKSGWESLPGLGQEDPQAFPLGFSADSETLYVGRISPAGTWALYPYDLRARSLGEPILAHAKYDVVHPVGRGWTNGINQQALVYSPDPKDRRLLGVRYATEYPRMLWLDEGLAQVQAALDTALPKKINTITNFSDDLQRMVVLSWTAQDPGTYYLFDRGAQKLEKLMATMPWIDPTKMADKKPFRFKARDGALLTGYITLPPGREAKNLPLIVMTDGLQVREYWGFDAGVQFWANRGYAVLQVNYRGLPGFGDPHYNLINKQAGRMVPADIADGVRWAISQKVIDPARIGIIGLGDFGAYLALQSLAEEPELYCCAVADSGLTDLVKFMDKSKVMPDFYNLFAERFGDPAKADEVPLLKDLSPYHNVDKIRAPVFITYSRKNFEESWYYNQSIDMASALKAAGKSVELIKNDDENYGYQTLAKYLNDRLAFVQKHMPTDN